MQLKKKKKKKKKWRASLAEVAIWEIDSTQSTIITGVVLFKKTTPPASQLIYCQSAPVHFLPRTLPTLYLR